MTSPLDTVPATQLEIFGTREMITALGKALIKKGVISRSDVASELSATIQDIERSGPRGYPHLIPELRNILGVVVGWGT